MQLVQAIFEKAYNFILVLKKRDYRNCAILMAGVAVVAMVVTGAAGFAGGGRNKVYAVQGGRVLKTGQEEDPDNELQAGLMGIVNGMNTLEEYSVAANSVDIANAGEEILVGTTKVKKNVLVRQAVENSTRQIGGIGYFAQQTVRNHHMATEDYYSLLQIVEAEATGGDIRSKMLVANVVLNRVKNSRFPDKIYDVIWDQEGGAPQFSPTADGRIYTVTITDDTIKAVDRVLAGEDYSEGALFFVARASADSHNVAWFDGTLERLYEYGGHEYYKFAE